MESEKRKTKQTKITKQTEKQYFPFVSLFSFVSFFFLMISLLFACPLVTKAHEGPPYPIIVDKPVGPCVVSVWADPDVGIGTFFVILEPGSGGAVPEVTKVEIAVQPVTGRLPETRHPATREKLRGRVQFKAEVPFDAQEFWRVRVVLQTVAGGGEVTTDVEVTPPGLGRWDLLLYLFPFVLIGLLWLKAFLRGRTRKKMHPKQNPV